MLKEFLVLVSSDTPSAKGIDYIVFAKTKKINQKLIKLFLKIYLKTFLKLKSIEDRKKAIKTQVLILQRTFDNNTDFNILKDFNLEKILIIFKSDISSLRENVTIQEVSGANHLVFKINLFTLNSFY